ncbi:MAG: T9SS type A sorting domain-containing protein [Saprospiraceae bacterium]
MKYENLDSSKSLFRAINFVVTIFLLSGICFAQGSDDSSKLCDNPDFTFEGESASTLCDEYGQGFCDIEIGLGTQFTHSSQLPTNYYIGKNFCIKGDFQIDKDFTFRDCIVKIDPGVTIFVQTGTSGGPFNLALTIDNSKLFACDDMWNGIRMSDKTTIATRYGTIIEDAEIAIKAENTQSSYVIISNTTFNRNRVGISFEEDAATPLGPKFFIFRDNNFRCTSPLNGTVDEITEIGVNIENAFDPFFDNPNSTNNTFTSIVNGIVATGDETDVTIYDFNFHGIRDNGIDFSGRALKVFDSTFENVQRNGIYFHFGLEMELRNNDFYLREDAFFMPRARYMVNVYAPLPGNSLIIEGNYFYTQDELFGGNLLGVSLYAESFLVLNAKIHNNKFDLLNSSDLNPGNPLVLSTTAITIGGNYSLGTDVDIEFNEINFNPYEFGINRGIRLGPGVKNGFKIVGNMFTGSGSAISCIGSDGEGNTVTSNKFFNDVFTSPLNFASGGMLFAMDFQNLSVCSNTIHSIPTSPWIFNGANNGMTFSGNVTHGGSQESFWIVGTNPVIGQQFLAGNEWFPTLRQIGNLGQFTVDIPHVRHAGTNLNLVERSKFFVSTEQSVIQNGQFSFFSKYHPVWVSPDNFPLEDAFFQFLNGSPNVACATQLTTPDKGDKDLADGTYGNEIESHATVWDAERHLYQKLKSNPSYETAYAGFTSFLQEHATSNIGKIYQLERKIYNSSMLEETMSTQIANTRSAIEELDQDISSLLNGSDYDEDAFQPLLEQRYNLVKEINIELEQFNDVKFARLTDAEYILQSIEPLTEVEVYRNNVFEIYLDAQLNQEGQYTLAQVENLKSIARLCSEVGGMAVYNARGLLSDCNLDEIMEEIYACVPELIVEPSNNSESENLMLVGGAPKEGFFFYPNPSQGKLVLSNSKGIRGNAEIINSAGQILQSRYIAEGEDIWLVDLPVGIYMFTVSFENGEVISDKLIINK